MLPKEFEGIRLFSPLTALMYGQEGYESDEPEEITPTQLCRYVSAIKKQLIKEQLDTEGDRGLAEYIRNRILRQKVFRMFPDVEVWQGELWGVLEIESYGKLSDTELNAVIAEWSGQASDRRGGLVCQFLEFGQRLFHYDRRKVKGCIIAAFRCREGRDRDADGMKEAGELGRGKIKR